jgi:hypothetical protein
LLCTFCNIYFFFASSNHIATNILYLEKGTGLSAIV